MDIFNTSLASVVLCKTISEPTLQLTRFKVLPTNKLWLSVIEQFGQPFKLVFSGKPSLVINKNGIDVKELKRNNLDVEDLIGALRCSGYYSLEQIAYAIFEANGNLSVMPYNDCDNTPTLPLLLVNCGKTIKNNLQTLKLGQDFMAKILKENNLAMQGEMCRTWKKSERIKKSLRKQNAILWRQKIEYIDRIKKALSLLSGFSGCQLCEHTQELAIKVEDILNGEEDEQWNKRFITNDKEHY